MALCKGCGAPITWIKSAAGKVIPCDSKPKRYWLDDAGPARIVTERGEVLRVRLSGDDGTEDGIGYLSHFATCPQAGQFRRRA